MFAVIETGGKQYKVQKDDVISVEKLNAVGGQKVQFNSVLLTGGEKIQIGNPHVKGAGVQAIVLEQLKSKKVVSFFKRRRKSSSKTKKGHRQQLTLVKITEILNIGAEKTDIAEAISGKGFAINYTSSTSKNIKTRVKSFANSIETKEEKEKSASAEKKEQKNSGESTEKNERKKTSKA